MDLETALRERRSIREFENRPVEMEKVQGVLEAANAAPSAGNLQAYEVVRVSDQGVRSDLARAALGQTFIADAPVVLVFLADPLRSSVRYGGRGRDLYCIQDATIACAYAHLRAADLGLGSVWVGAFDDEAVRRAVGAPAEQRPIAILPLGYSGESPPPSRRRGVSDLLHQDRF